MTQPGSNPAQLRDLVHDEAELVALRRNGAVYTETHRGRPLYKLRFRVEHEQCVRSLGRNPVVAAAVQRELDLWQLGRRDELAIARAVKTGRRILNGARAQLNAEAEADGYHFHGRALRRRRKPICRVSVRP